MVFSTYKYKYILQGMFQVDGSLSNTWDMGPCCLTLPWKILTP